MKTKTIFLMALVSFILISCSKDQVDTKNENDSVWGFYWDTWESSYLKSYDLESGKENNSIILENINSGSNNLVYNEIENSFIFNYRDSLVSVNLNNNKLTKIMNLDGNIYGLEINNAEQTLYGLMIIDSLYQFISIDLVNKGLELIVPNISKYEDLDNFNATYNPNGNAYYFRLNDSLYNIDISRRSIEIIENIQISGIEYNPLTDLINGLVYSDCDFKLITLDLDLNTINIVSFSEKIYVYNLTSMNPRTGDYIIKGCEIGSGTIMKSVKPDGTVTKLFDAEIENCLEFQLPN